MSALPQESKTGSPSPETAALFYRDAPDRPTDETYTHWLAIARADRAEALRVLLENETLLAEHEGVTPRAMRAVCDLPTLVGLLRNQARDNDTIAREIIADPRSASSRRRMENAVAARR
mgnify:CR=1 FL=1